MKALFLLLFALPALAQSLVVMTHVQSEYDNTARLKPHIDNLLNKLSNPKKVALYNNLDTWNGPIDESTESIYSKFGEHNLSAETIYLTGAQMGACLQYTIRDFLQYRKKTMTIIVNAQTVMTIEEELLSERLELTPRSEWNVLFYHYFSRMLFNEKSKKVKKAKINLYLNDDLIGSIKSSGLGAPYLQPDLKIKVITPLTPANNPYPKVL
jgi:hypothetical protein